MTANVSILAAFVSPVLFAVGAGAVSVPILIHILSRRRFRRVRWAAIEFLLQAEQRNRRRVRMDEWILLALRCLAVLLVALLIARPFTRPTDSGAAWASAGRTERVFVIDDSFSMGYQWDGRSAMDRGKEAVRRLIDVVRVEAPDDTVSILRMSDPAHPVEFGTFLDETQTDSLLARLTAVPVTQRAIDPKAVIDGVVDVLQRGGAVSGAVVYLISDFQRHNWAHGPGTEARPAGVPGGDARATGGGDARSTGGADARATEREAEVGSDLDSNASQGEGAGTSRDVLAPLAEWASKDHGLRLVLVNVGSEHPANLAVTDLALGSGSLIVGAPGKLTAELTNHADTSAEHVSLDLTVGPASAPVKSVREVGPHQSMPIDLDVSFLHAGDEAVRVQINEDALPIDDARYAVAPIRNSMRVLVVNGEPSEDVYVDEVSLLAAALRPEGDVFSGNELTIVDEVEFERTALDSGAQAFDVVVLANVYRLSAVALDALEAYVRDGGGLMVFMGDQVNPAWYVSSMLRDGEGLLPAEPVEIIRPATTTRLVVTDPLHPALRGLAREGDPLGIGQIGFFGFYAVRPVESGTEARPTGIGADGQQGDTGGDARATDSDGDVGSVEPGGDARATGSGGDARAGETGAASLRSRYGALAAAPARVLARFDDSAEHPAIIERPYGKGRVVMFTSTADKEWNDWPAHPTYLPMLMEFVQHVARRGEAREDTLVGTPIELRVDPATYEPDAMLRTPSYPDEREIGVSASPAGDGRGVMFRWERTDAAGVYRFVLTRRDGGEESRMAAVNPDPAESDLTRATPVELRHAMQSVPFEYVEGVEGLSSGGSESRTEYWPIMLILAMGLFMGEQAFAWWCGRRR